MINMTITVLGWYGTETIGDRAILSGIFDIYANMPIDSFEVKLGSLIPHLTERTWFEDKDFYKAISNGKLKNFSIFYSLDKSLLKNNIEKSDMVIVGGGPLMDIKLMHMLRYAFRYAKKKNKKTALVGCGWGPLHEDEYIKITSDLVDLSDVTIFRDSKSQELCLQYKCRNCNIYSSVDPAFFAARFFRSTHTRCDNKHISVNLRELYVTDEKTEGKFSLDYCLNFINCLLETYPTESIVLIPMHTYYFGGDDRIILNKICMRLNNERVCVQNEPLSLEKTMELYYNSSISVGMRFHSILLQTVLNGCNYVLDYTDPEIGKTVNLLKQINVFDEYKKNRYISCCQLNEINLSKQLESVVIDDSFIINYRNLYVDKLNKLII